MKNFKKMAALWVVGCLAAAGSVFALDLGNGFSLSGEVVGGVKVVTQDDGVDDNTDTKISAVYDDWGDTLPRFRLNAAWSNDVFGVKGRLEVTDWLPTGAFGFGWINFGKYVTLYTGSIDDSHFGTGDVAFNKNVDSGDGFKLLIKPIEALTIGAYVPFVLNTDIDTAFGNMTIGASFAHKLVNVAVALKLGSVKEDESYAGYTAPEDYSGIALLYHVSSAPIPALGIDISGYLLSGDYPVTDYIGNDANGVPRNGFAIAPRITYSAGPISAYGKLTLKTYAVPDGELFDGAELTDDSDIDLEFQAKYTVGKFAPFLRFGLGVGDGDMDASGARVRVGTGINLSDGLSFEVYDQIGRIAAKDVEATTDSAGKPVAGKKGIENTFRAQIKYTF